MLHSEAATTVIPFGRYKGKTLAEVSFSYDGMLYLDWVIGQAWLSSELKHAIQIYLSDPVIAQHLEECLEDPDSE